MHTVAYTSSGQLLFLLSLLFFIRLLSLGLQGLSSRVLTMFFLDLSSQFWFYLLLVCGFLFSLPFVTFVTLILLYYRYLIFAVWHWQRLQNLDRLMSSAYAC